MNPAASAVLTACRRVSERTRHRWLLLTAGILLVASFTVSCGRKTDPLTPASPRPEAVHDIKAVTRDAYVFLSWPVPTRNIEGKEMSAAELFGFRVYRAEVERDRKKPRYRQVSEITLANPEPATILSGTLVWGDGPLKYGRVYAYRIVALSMKGGVSPPSAEVRAAPLLSLASPGQVAAVAGENSVALTWNPVTTRADGSTYTGFVGYNLYRRKEKGAYGMVPLNKEPVRTTTYHDTSVDNDQTYLYMVRAVDSPAVPWKESLDSGEAVATPRKVTPPARPAGLTVVPGVGRVFLTWNENKEGDLAGYHVYRSTRSGRDYERLTDKPLARTTYSDEAVKPRTTYYYVVTAIDKAGNESQPSKEQKAFAEKRQ